LLKTPLRWSGGIILICAVVWAFVTPQPDVLISSDGQSVAVRAADGRLRLMQTRKDAFLVREWLAADADSRLPNDPSLGQGTACDDAGCATRMSDGAYVAIATRPDAFVDDCSKAAVVVTSRDAPPVCSALVFDQDRLRQSGSVALRQQGQSWVVDRVRPDGTDRPWSHVERPVAAKSTARRQSGTRPVDATPAESDLNPEDQ
jgi:competence protein ComEC